MACWFRLPNPREILCPTGPTLAEMFCVKAFQLSIVLIKRSLSEHSGVSGSVERIRRRRRAEVIRKGLDYGLQAYVGEWLNRLIVVVTSIAGIVGSMAITGQPDQRQQRRRAHSARFMHAAWATWLCVQSYIHVSRGTRSQDRATVPDHGSLPCYYWMPVVQRSGACRPSTYAHCSSWASL